MCTKKLKETPPQWVEGLRIFFRIVTICKVERKNKKGKVKRISPFMGNSVFSVILDRDSTRNMVVYLLRRVANLGPCHFLFFLSLEIDEYSTIQENPSKHPEAWPRKLGAAYRYRYLLRQSQSREWQQLLLYFL